MLWIEIRLEKNKKAWIVPGLFQLLSFWAWCCSLKPGKSYRFLILLYTYGSDMQHSYHVYRTYFLTIVVVCYAVVKTIFTVILYIDTASCVLNWVCVGGRCVSVEGQASGGFTLQSSCFFFSTDSEVKAEPGATDPTQSLRSEPVACGLTLC